jgi:hypothetical protein
LRNWKKLDLSTKIALFVVGLILLVFLVELLICRNCSRLF